MRDNLAQRMVKSVGWNAGANGVVVLLSLFRSILLARWLPVEVFGIYAGANALVGLTAILAGFGMGAAFTHRAPETEDEEKAARVLFSLRMIFTAFWITVLVSCALIYTEGIQQTTIVVLTVIRGLTGMAMMASMILKRRVVHRRMAMIQSIDALLITVVSLSIAWNDGGIWALLATDIASLLLLIVGMYFWRPVWKPRFGWDRSVVSYYLRFGSQNFLADALVPALEKIDDLWTAVYLGATATGFYSRAYSFATYPRLIVAWPVTQVAGGAFAELKSDRLRLSKAFFRTNALLIRTGFILAGILVLTAPELITIVLGDKWLPMLEAFRLMLIYALFDPLKSNLGSLFLAVGRPATIVRVRLVQLAVLLAGLYILGSRFGIAGVALAVDGMLIVGIVLFFYQAREWVDFSLRTLFLVPLVALLGGLLLSYYLESVVDVSALWLNGFMKTAVFAVVYSGVLFVFERRKSWEMFKGLRKLWLEERANSDPPAGG